MRPASADAPVNGPDNRGNSVTLTPSLPGCPVPPGERVRCGAPPAEHRRGEAPLPQPLPQSGIRLWEARLAPMMVYAGC